MLLQDKNNAIAKQANKLALRKALTFQNEWNEKGENVACERRGRDGKKKAKWKEQTAELYWQCWNVEMKRWWVEYRMKTNWNVKADKWNAEEARWGSLGETKTGRQATNRAENWCNVACHSSSKTCFCASQQVARTRQHQSFWLWHRFLPWF